MKTILFFIFLQVYCILVMGQNNAEHKFHISVGYAYYNQYGNVNGKAGEESSAWLQMGYFVAKRTFVGMEFENGAYKLPANYSTRQVSLPKYEYVYENTIKIIGKYRVIEQKRMNVTIGSGLFYKLSTKDFFQPVYESSGIAYEKELAYTDKLGIPFFNEIQYDVKKKLFLGLRLSHNMVFKAKDPYSIGIMGGIKF